MRLSLPSDSEFVFKTEMEFAAGKKVELMPSVEEESLAKRQSMIANFAVPFLWDSEISSEPTVCIRMASSVCLRTVDSYLPLDQRIRCEFEGTDSER